MPSLRILHVVPYYEHAWAYGGIPRLTTALTRALARRGHDVTVCTTDACDESSRSPLPVANGAPGTPDIRIFPNLSNSLAYRLQLFAPWGFGSYMRASAAQFDIAHLHACHNVLTVRAARALARANVPYVISPNGTARPIERRVLAKRLFAATIGRHVLGGASRVLAVTDVERRDLQSLVPDALIDIIPNPIDPREFDPPPDAAAFRQAHALEDRRIILFLGKLTPRKGVDVLLSAFARMPADDRILVIAGNDMGSAAPLKRMAVELGIVGRVVWPGLLRARTRLSALAAADVVVYPSRDEIFGLVPIEALLCGAPVIVCNDSGCGEVVGNIGGGEIVPYGDAAALANAIETILRAPGLWRQRARASAVRIRQRFAVHAVCDRLERVYEDVIRRHTGIDKRRSA